MTSLILFLYSSGFAAYYIKEVLSSGLSPMEIFVYITCVSMTAIMLLVMYNVFLELAEEFITFRDDDLENFFSILRSLFIGFLIFPIGYGILTGLLKIIT